MDREEVQWEGIYANISLSLKLGILNIVWVKICFLYILLCYSALLQAKGDGGISVGHLSSGNKAATQAPSNYWSRLQKVKYIHRLGMLEHCVCLLSAWWEEEVDRVGIWEPGME